MSHALSTSTPSLEGRDDAAFELQIRHAAHARLRRARQHHAQPAAPHNSRRQMHALKCKRAAVTAALLAFGVGLLWPVASPEFEPAAPQSARVRVLRAEQLASLDASAEPNH